MHVDIKKVGRMSDGGGWAVHGRGSTAALASKRKGSGTGRVGNVAYGELGGGDAELVSARLAEAARRLGCRYVSAGRRSATYLFPWHRAAVQFLNEVTGHPQIPVTAGLVRRW